ncbi:hypothetical protein IQ268_25010 [Oculatella sp. LEGE 06141]|uniref:Asr1405/Asl0597 family protein n=1 Tax=Oculatella sp. LEGE 06141 TaxID=1828648 RepID=UPI00188223B8|nr:Asr1405/Asl0597 family protein [Oculatella sp. LEGE 06141]MBE9181832.1 hypothetical protein [Oculatella sp. LEGE 06141]
MDHSQSPVSTRQLISISRSDRWQICYRLQELGIACTCLDDGSFHAEVDSPVAMMQLRSVLLQLTASRQQLVEWLERCW